MSKTVPFETIQFSISTQFKCKDLFSLSFIIIVISIIIIIIIISCSSSIRISMPPSQIKINLHKFYKYWFTMLTFTDFSIPFHSFRFSLNSNYFV